MVLLIALLQGVVGMALTSGLSLGDQFTQRFFADSGPMGALRRCLGLFVLTTVVSLYLFDIGSNFLAFNGDATLEATPGGMMRVLALLFAAGFVTLA